MADTKLRDPISNAFAKKNIQKSEQTNTVTISLQRYISIFLIPSIIFSFAIISAIIHQIIFQASAINMVVVAEKYSTDLSKNVTNIAHISIAPKAYKNDLLHWENFNDLISLMWNDRKNIHQIIRTKNRNCSAVIVSHKKSVATNIVTRGYAFAILADIPANHVCRLFE